MRNLKKALCLVMTIAMLMSMMVFTTSAASFTDADEVVNTEAVNTMNALNIINGKGDGSYFDPSGIVTRAEMAKMICVALNGGKDPQLGTTAYSFTDTAGNWAAGYIEYCYNLGIVSGRGDGTFDPTGTVTGTEAAKMLLVAIGYDAAAEGFTGASWAIAVNVRANQKNFYTDLASMNPASGLTRDNAAQMVYNAINAVKVEYTYSLTTVNGSLQSVAVVKDVTTSATILSEKFKMVTEYGMITTASYSKTTGKYTYTVIAPTIAGTAFSYGSFTSTTDFSDLIRMNVKIMYSNNTAGTAIDKVFGLYAEKSSVILSGVIGSLPDVAAADASFKVDGVTYKFDTDADTALAYNYNVVASVGDVKDSTATGVTTNDAYSYKMFDTDDDGKIDTMMIYPFVAAKVTYVGATTFSVSAAIDTVFTFTTEDVNVYDGMAKGDYVIATEKANTVSGITTFEKAVIVSGKVDGVQTGKVLVDGNWYKAAPALLAGSATISLGDTVNLTTFNGYYVYAKVDTVLSATDLLVVLNKNASANLSGNYSTKVLFADGSTSVVDCDISATLGAIYSYELSDGVYKLTAATTANTGYDGTVSGVGFVASTDKMGTSTYVADDAVVFIVYKNSTSTNNTTTTATDVAGSASAIDDMTKATVITGADLKTWGSDFGDTTYTAGFTKMSNGYSYAKVILLVADAQALSASGDTAYGYIVSAPYMIKDGTDYYITFDLWNGTTTSTVKDKVTSSTAVSAPYAKGEIISYTDAGNGLVDNVSNTGMTKGAVLAYDGDKNIMIGSSTTAGDPAYSAAVTIDSDTKFFYFDSKNVAGVAGGSAVVANELATAGTYDMNVVVLANGTKVAALWIEVNNKIDGSTACDNRWDVAVPTITAEAGYTIAADKVLAEAGDTVTVTVTVTAAAASKSLAITATGAASVTPATASHTTGTAATYTFTVTMGSADVTALSVALT